MAAPSTAPPTAPQRFDPSVDLVTAADALFEALFPLLDRDGSGWASEEDVIAALICMVGTEERARVALARVTESGHVDQRCLRELIEAQMPPQTGENGAQWHVRLVRFVLAMPLAVRCGNGLMLSHSLPSPHELDGFDPGILDRALAGADYALRTGSAWRMTWGRGWDRDELARLGALWGVRTFVLGHAYVEHGAEAPFPNLLLLNSDHGHGRVVAVDLAADAPDADTMVMESVPLSAYGAADA